MTEIAKQKVDSNSPEFKKGVEAGLNSTEDTKNWKAGNELGQELKTESEAKEPQSGSTSEKSTALFMRSNSGVDDDPPTNPKRGS
jgi:hypothetical protein